MQKNNGKYVQWVLNSLLKLRRYVMCWHIYGYQSTTLVQMTFDPVRPFSYTAGTSCIVSSVPVPLFVLPLSFPSTPTTTLTIITTEPTF